VKRYLIEPDATATQEANSGTDSSDGSSSTKRKMVYRIVDTSTQQVLPPESEDIGAIASTCAELNEADATSAQTASSLPGDIAQSIAISNAKSIGEQPAILANLALAQQIFNQNMRQQIALSEQQAMNQIRLAAVAKCVAMIDNLTEASQATMEKAGADIKTILQVMEHIIGRKPNDAEPPQAH
jgi:hypothetical protein